MPRSSLRSRTAVITGAGSGIGRALALQLATHGANVTCADIDPGTAAVTAQRVTELGGSGHAVECDVRDLAAVERLADATTERFGTPADLVVNNAGIGAGGRPIGEESIELWHRVIDINMWGVINGCHVFAPRLRAQGGGGIINLASAAGFAAGAGMGPYNVSKAAVMSLSETLSAELAGAGVTVTVVCPTFVRTNIVSAGEIDPELKDTAQRLMAMTGRSADSVAKLILARHAAGKAYVVPQLEARAVWAAKRHTPTAYLRATGAASRLLGVGRPTTTAVPPAPRTDARTPDPTDARPTVAVTDQTEEVS